MKTLLLAALAAVFCCFLSANAEKNSYNGYKVFSIKPKVEKDLTFLRKYLENVNFDIWKSADTIGLDMDVMVNDEKTLGLVNVLRRLNIDYSIKIDDVGQLIDEVENKNNMARQFARSNDVQFDWTSYHKYDEIVDFLDTLAASYPELVTVTNIGRSEENRMMKMVKISTGGDGTKPAIFVEGGIHAREWIAPAAVTYMINELVVNSWKYQSSLDAIDFFFVASSNPDGYVYSWDSDRMWRKNRGYNEDSNCMGADGNRNWDYRWSDVGASDWACAETFCGPVPFSEPNTQNLRDQIMAIRERAAMYIAVHSYGALILRPWGWARNMPTEDENDLLSLCEDSAAALKATHGTTYDCILSGDLYPASGASDDWAYGAAGIKYSYTFELFGGRYGFVLPPEFITRTVEEVWAAFEVMFEHIRDDTKTIKPLH